MRRSSPNQPLISFYGDDFTGSTDAMEALALNGIRTVLFLEPPAPALLERFPDIQGFGVAGISRAMEPQDMERELRPVFAKLAAVPTPIVHYKICSTFDSSPHVGSIGKAIDIGGDVFFPAGQQYIPLLVGAPELKRYTVFGNHFASAGDAICRLDRHPTMAKHPVTPMDEGDLRIHLGKQTGKKIALVDVLDLELADAEQLRERLTARLSDGAEIVLFDVLDEPRLKRAGELLWQAALEGQRFIVGSSGVEYALTAYWQSQGFIVEKRGMLEAGGSAGQILAVSGSCSPVTAAQLQYAMDHGFVGIKIPAEALIDPDRSEEARRGLFLEAAAILEHGQSPLLYTAMGPQDESIRATQQLLADKGMQAYDTGRLIGEQLGKLTREIVAAKRLKRVLAAGGDTSGFVTRELGIYALECLMPIAPGGPLCRSYSDDSRFDGLEVVLKGGQVGKEDYFVRVLEGR